LDADDSWVPEKLARQAASIRPETVLVYTGLRIFDDYGIRAERPAIDAIAAIKMLRYHNPITPSTVLVRREAIMRIGGFHQGIRSCEDWEMWVRLQRLGEFEAVAGVLTNYYVYPGSLSSNPEVMLHSFNKIIDTTLLDGLHGLGRWIWKRRIIAAQLCSAGLIARDHRLKNEVPYMFQSLCTWPSPFWQPRRFAMFAVSAKNMLRRKRE
jgi:hypothetical protein